MSQSSKSTKSSGKKAGWAVAKSDNKIKKKKKFKAKSSDSSELKRENTRGGAKIQGSSRPTEPKRNTPNKDVAKRDVKKEVKKQVLKPGVNYTRLNKIISESGYCSRREADKLIEEGKVKVNGMPTELGTMVGPRDRVTINNKPLQEKPKEVYLAFNKPVGVECTTDRNTKNNIIDYINYHERIFPIGRLDKESDGLILLTNNGDVVNPILRAGNAHEKEYIVSVNKPISPKFISDMAKGVPILDTVTLPCKVDQIDKYKFKIILIQGLNRQIRRMCEHLGYEVKTLSRIRIMNVNIGNLKKGSIRKLSPKEVGTILAAIKHSKGTEEASK